MKSWRKGPIQHKICQPPHDRPIFCMAVSHAHSKFVTGSADHGLREYNIQNGKHIRQLFAKKYGHKEWVSTCAYTPSGCVISGGMDSVVCFWDSKAVRCDHFTGHQGSISKVMADDRIGISASYDATVMLWDLNRRSECQKLIGPHKEAVMTFDWHESLLITGDKSGVIGIWDLNQGELIRATRTHKGAVNKIVMDQKLGIFHSIGLNDGSLASVDMRTNNGIYKKMLHKGALNDIKISNNKIITCSADHTVSLLQGQSFTQIFKTDIKDMGFALEYVEDVIIVATGGGNIVAVDGNTGEVLYGYGVMKKGECRILGVSGDKRRLVCAGEDDAPSLLFY